MQFLEQTCAALEDDKARLTSDLSSCRRVIADQSAEITTLTSSNTDLNQKLDKSTTRIQKLVIQIDQSKLELEKALNQLRDKDSVINKMQTELTQLIQELAEKTKQFQLKEIEFDQLVIELRALIETLQLSVTNSNKENERLRKTVMLLRDEIEMLKKKLASDTRFRQFVDVKREYNTLKDVSGTLAQKVQIYESEIPLPVVKKSGRTATKKSAVSGAGTRPRTAILNRPKSSRNVIRRPPTADSSIGNMSDFDGYNLSRPQSSASVLRSRCESRCQSILGHHHIDASTDEYALDGAGLSERLTSLLRHGRPKTSIVRSSSALSNSRNVRTMNESPMQMAVDHNAIYSQSHETGQSVNRVTRRHSSVDNHMSVIESVANVNNPRDEPATLIENEQQSNVKDPIQGNNETSNDRLCDGAHNHATNDDDVDDDDDDDVAFSDMSFHDLVMDDVIEL